MLHLDIKDIKDILYKVLVTFSTTILDGPLAIPAYRLEDRGVRDGVHPE